MSSRKQREFRGCDEILHRAAEMPVLARSQVWFRQVLYKVHAPVMDLNPKACRPPVGKYSHRRRCNNLESLGVFSYHFDVDTVLQMEFTMQNEADLLLKSSTLPLHRPHSGGSLTRQQRLQKRHFVATRDGHDTVLQKPCEIVQGKRASISAAPSDHRSSSRCNPGPFFPNAESSTQPKRVARQ